MPPSGGTRVSLSAQARMVLAAQARSSGQWPAEAIQAFQPATGVFSPGLPLQPSDPQPTRLVDFDVGRNTVITPRASEPFGFASLRAFANVEPVRLAIETRKDQIERLDWQIKLRGSGRLAGARRRSEAQAGAIQAVERFFRKPDGVNPFATWLRLALEDLLVIDAPAFEKRRDRVGRLIGLDVVPGDTILVLTDETGRRPAAPVPAYQQIIKGRVWNNLTTDDLIYAPRNPRPGHFYGMGPVEQVIVTINTVLRRQAVQLAYFTEGNAPAGILNAPDTWNPDQIKAYQDWFNACLSGNAAERSKLIWAPSGAKYQAFKDSPLKDDFDEWLYRVVCYAFSLPATPFVRQMNRSTADNDSQRGAEEGLQPLKFWWKRIADQVIEELGCTDLEWAWTEDREIDGATQSVIDDRDLRNGTRTLNEIRDSRGLDPVEGGDQPLIYTGSGPVPLTSTTQAAPNPPGDPASQLTRAGEQEGQGA